MATAVHELELASFAVVFSLGIDKLGRSPGASGGNVVVPEFEQIIDQDPMRCLRAVRVALQVRIQTLGAMLAAEHSA